MTNVSDSLYLDAIATACSGIFTIGICGFADYKNYRKTIMMACILVFGALAIPYVGLGAITFRVLTASSVLFVLIQMVQGAFGAIEFSYIPLFMRAHLDVGERPRGYMQRYLEHNGHGKDECTRLLYKGSKVSVLGLLVANLGSITALLIGVIITYSQHTQVALSWHSFLVAITIAGSMTLVLGTVAGILLPTVKGKEVDASNILLPFRHWAALIQQMTQFPEPWKLCVGWIIWYIGWSSQLRLIGLLFREVLGIASSTPIYTVWSFTSVIFSTLGSLLWMLLYPYAHLGVKTWAYTFLGIQLVCIIWGTLGISAHVPIGFKHGPEFWIEQILFMSTSSALRALNRALYAALIPKDSEALFYGLQIVLDLATGWIAPLVTGTIQDRTHELRFSMIPNASLVCISVGFYIWLDVEQGIKQAQNPLKSNACRVEREHTDIH